MQLAIHSPYARGTHMQTTLLLRHASYSPVLFFSRLHFLVSGPSRGDAFRRSAWQCLPPAHRHCHAGVLPFFFVLFWRNMSWYHGLPSICSASTARKPLGGLLPCGGRRAQSAWRRRVTNKQTAATVWVCGGSCFCLELDCEHIL